VHLAPRPARARPGQPAIAENTANPRGTRVAIRSLRPPERGIKENRMDTQNRKKEVFTITEKPHPEGGSKSYFIKCGVAFVNRDGSYTIKLDALPVSGVLQVRDERAYPDRQVPREVPTPPPPTNHSDVFGGS
jgi:hypothetical protein